MVFFVANFVINLQYYYGGLWQVCNFINMSSGLFSMIYKIKLFSSHWQRELTESTQKYWVWHHWHFIRIMKRNIHRDVAMDVLPAQLETWAVPCHGERILFPPSKETTSGYWQPPSTAGRRAKTVSTENYADRDRRESYCLQVIILVYSNFGVSLAGLSLILHFSRLMKAGKTRPLPDPGPALGSLAANRNRETRMKKKKGINMLYANPFYFCPPILLSSLSSNFKRAPRGFDPTVTAF
jgi:hypothetical protein